MSRLDRSKVVKVANDSIVLKIHDRPWFAGRGLVFESKARHHKHPEANHDRRPSKSARRPSIPHGGKDGWRSRVSLRCFMKTHPS